MGGGKKRVSGDRSSTLWFQGNHPPKPQGKMIMGGLVAEYNDAQSVGGGGNGAALSNKPQSVDSA